MLLLIKLIRSIDESITDSNTSHVTINPNALENGELDPYNSNTSHVTINQFANNVMELSDEFKYISCYY